MIRVLHVLNNLGSGGAESFVMNIYRNIDRTEVQFDFLIRSNQNGSMVKEISDMGGKVFILPSFPKHVFENYRKLDYFLRNHSCEYTAIHVHANALIYVKPLQLAEKYKIPIRIIHSHSTNSKMALLHKVNILRIDKWCTTRFACSELAGEWMFPKRQYKIIPNGISLERFKFNNYDRDKVRKIYDLDNKIVIGHVGRFTTPKNHPFIINLFEEYHKRNRDSALMLVGDGENKEHIKMLVKEKGLTDSVFFVGAVSNVWEYMSAMDIFLFPSFYEGFGIVLLEAQANGLPCVVSNVISNLAIVNENIVSLGLDKGLDVWLKALEQLNSERLDVLNDALYVYDIKKVSRDLELFYQKQVLT